MPQQRTSSVWFDPDPPLPKAATLEKDVSADVCVVGAGIAGLSVAYLLSRAGKSVVVLDAASAGAGETARTTAHLASVLDDRFVNLEKLHGADGSKLAYESHAAAIDTVERIARDERIECQFSRVPGFLFLGQGDTPANLKAEMEAAQRAGLKASWLEAVPGLPASLGPGVRFENQARFQPMAYLAGLAKASGATIYGDCLVNEFKGGDDAHVKTRAGRRVSAAAVVVATNSPANTQFTFHTSLAAYRTYAVALEAPADAADGLFWDTEDPYHYVRFHDAPSGRQLIAGGADHRTGQEGGEASRFDLVEAWARSRWPGCGKRVGFWSGQVLEPVDGLAYIGRNEANLYVATGDSGMGLTHGTIAGLLLTDLILGRESPWAKLYDPARVRVRSAGDYVSENLSTAATYADYLTRGEVPEVSRIEPGQGAIVREGLSKMAVSRDESGKVCALSAVCPHLGGLVRWNDAEGTWDCPAHGSRFAACGTMLNGPATKPLEGVAVPK